MPVRTGSWEELKTQLIPLRTEVFIDEQQVPVELEWDDEDNIARHILATAEDHTLIGCARLLPSGQIGRMAVILSRRGQGWGKQLLAEAEATARAMGQTEVFLHAQTHAIPFYAAQGYHITSDEFMDAGIPHRTMHKLLIDTKP